MKTIEKRSATDNAKDAPMFGPPAVGAPFRSAPAICVQRTQKRQGDKIVSIDDAPISWEMSLAFGSNPPLAPPWRSCAPASRMRGCLVESIPFAEQVAERTVPNVASSIE